MPKIDATLEAMRAARGSQLPDEVIRAITTGTGLVGYDLEAPALALYPWGDIFTLLRNRIPRVKGNTGATAINWKAITAINQSNQHAGVGEGNRGPSIVTTTASYTAPYVTLGLEDSVTFEAEESSQGFDDVKARAALGLLRSLMLQEERMLVGGNGSFSIGQATAPTLGSAASGGSVPNGTYNVYVVPLTRDGYARAVVGAAGVTQSIARSNADGSSDTVTGFAGNPSTATSTGSLSGGSAQVIQASTPVVQGAFGYAWYVGTAGNERIQAVTTLNTVLLTAIPSAPNQLFSALTTGTDLSADNVHNFDGLLTIATKPASNAYFKALATGPAATGVGTPLTSDSKAGIVEINNMLNTVWDNFAFEFDEFIMHRQTAESVSQLILAATGGPLFRIDLKASRWEFFHEEKDLSNVHLQFEPSEGRMLLVQQNRGRDLNSKDPNAPLSGELGAALYVVDSDGKNQRFLPFGPPWTAFVDGHQCWIGRTKRVLASIEETRTVGGLYTVAPGDAAATRLTPGFSFIHVCASADGRFLVGNAGNQRYVYMGSLETGRIMHLCEAPCSRSGGHPTWDEPYIVPGNRHVVFNSERSGHPELYVATVPEHVTAYLASK